MALQGTLETFSVPEVLRLLASTAKTGLMALNGDRGQGKVWLEDGSIIAASSDQESGDVEAVLFDLLRFRTGDFVFETDEKPDEPGDVINVDEALDRAESMLEEWKDITSIIPSLHVGLRIVERIDGESVTVSASQWEALAAVGGGTTPAALRRRFELTEMDAYRRARDLVDAGLVEVDDEVAADPAPSPAPAAPSAPLLSDDEVVGLGSDLAGFVAQPAEESSEEPSVAWDTASTDDESVPDAPDVPATVPDASDLWEPDRFDEPAESAGESADETSQDTHEPEPSAEAEVAADAAAGDQEGDFFSQLSSLSPKAAAAVEATAEEAGGTNDADLAGDLPADAGDEEINRNLLLKFLSSTKN